MSARVAMLHCDTVFRIHWVLNTDLLLGVCHCGAEHTSEDPVELWDWLLGHPRGHQPPEQQPVPPSVRELARV